MGGPKAPCWGHVGIMLKPQGSIVMSFWLTFRIRSRLKFGAMRFLCLLLSFLTVLCLCANITLRSHAKNPSNTFSQPASHNDIPDLDEMAVSFAEHAQHTGGVRRICSLRSPPLPPDCRANRTFFMFSTFFVSTSFPTSFLCQFQIDIEAPNRLTCP